jgi:hypothetical protein
MTPERFYKILLKLYPREFRDRYGEEMTRVFQESLNSQSSSFGFWVRTFWDVISSAGRERILGGRDMNNALVKIGGIAALIYGLVPILLIPFLQTQAPVMYGFNLIYNSLISFLFNAAPLGLAISGAFAYSSQAHTRVERFGLHGLCRIFAHTKLRAELPRIHCNLRLSMGLHADSFWIASWSCSDGFCAFAKNGYQTLAIHFQSVDRNFRRVDCFGSDKQSSMGKPSIQ